MVKNARIRCESFLFENMSMPTKTYTVVHQLFVLVNCVATIYGFLSDLQIRIYFLVWLPDIYDDYANAGGAVNSD